MSNVITLRTNEFMKRATREQRPQSGPGTKFVCGPQESWWWLNKWVFTFLPTKSDYIKFRHAGTCHGNTWGSQEKVLAQENIVRTEAKSSQVEFWVSFLLRKTIYNCVDQVLIGRSEKYFCLVVVIDLFNVAIPFSISTLILSSYL